MTLRSRINSLVFTAASLVAASGATGQTGRYEMLWGAFGPNEPQVQTVQLPQVRRDGAIVLYTGQAGLYPKEWQGQDVNGGVPVACNMNLHLTKLRADIERFIPSNFTGYAVIDYEDWDALWVDTPELYREKTRAVVRAQYANLTPQQVEEYSIRDHEAAARDFLLQTLNTAKSLRPNAKWGYYGYPRVHHVEHLSSMQWLWDAQTAFYPVAYTVYPMSEIRPTPWDHAEPAFFPNLMQTLVGTSRQIAGPNRPVAAFVWCRYHNINPTFQYQLLNETDLRRMMREPRLKGADAAIFWDYIDSAQDVSEYHSYFTSTLGRVLGDVDLEFNPPSNNQTGGNSGGGSGNNNNTLPPDRNTPPPPPPAPPANTNAGANAAPPSSGNTGTYTNTSLPGAPWTNPNTQASSGDGGEPAPAPGTDPNQAQQQPADPNAPAAGTDPNQPPKKADKKSKQKKGVGTKTNTRFTAAAKPTNKRVLQRDLDRIAALKRAQERARLRNANTNSGNNALADAPTGD